jgi:hypothetical protein
MSSWEIKATITRATLRNVLFACEGQRLFHELDANAALRESRFTSRHSWSKAGEQCAFFAVIVDQMSAQVRIYV